MQFDLKSLLFSEEAEALANHWRNLPREKGAICPKKDDFSPIQLRSNLKSILLMKREDENHLSVRVAGSLIRDYVGVELTGCNLFDFLPSEFSYRVRRYFDGLQQYQCAGTLFRLAARPIGGRHMVKVLHLPLLSKSGEATYFVGALTTEAVPNLFQSHLHDTHSAQASLEERFYDLGNGTPPEIGAEPALT